MISFELSDNIIMYQIYQFTATYFIQFISILKLFLTINMMNNCLELKQAIPYMRFALRFIPQQTKII